MWCVRYSHRLGVNAPLFGTIDSSALPVIYLEFPSTIACKWSHSVHVTWTSEQRRKSETDRSEWKRKCRKGVVGKRDTVRKPCRAMWHCKLGDSRVTRIILTQFSIDQWRHQVEKHTDKMCQNNQKRPTNHALHHYTGNARYLGSPSRLLFMVSAQSTQLVCKHVLSVGIKWRNSYHNISRRSSK
jgi:hypothetical protein